MTLRQRQIKAVKATLEQVKEEYAQDKKHHWLRSKCPLCRLGCSDCPIPDSPPLKAHPLWDNCANLSRGGNISHETIAGFLQSLLVSL